MSDEKTPATATEKSPPEATRAAPDSIREVEDSPISMSTLRSNRMWAAAGYLSFFVGFWIVVPAIAYAWKGRYSRFVAFHAVQAVLLQVALIPCMGVGMGISNVLRVIGGTRRGHETLPEVVAGLVFAFLVTLPVLASAWLGINALRGKTRTLPVLGRWAKRVVKDAATP